MNMNYCMVVVLVLLAGVSAQDTCLPLQLPNAALGLSPSRCWLFLGNSYGGGTAAPMISVSSTPRSGGFPTSCRSDSESAVGSMDAMAAFLSDKCYSNMMRFFCRRFYPPCNYNKAFNGGYNTNSPIPFVSVTFNGSQATADAQAPLLNLIGNPDLAAAPEVCDDVVATCSATELAYIKGFLTSAWTGTSLAKFIQFIDFTQPKSFYPNTNQSMNPYYPCFGGLNANSNSQAIAQNASLVPTRKPLCQPYRGSVCSGAVDTSVNVYTPQGQMSSTTFVTSQDAVESTLAKANFLFYLAPQPVGRLDYIKLTCAAAFPPCQTVSAGGLPVWAPQLARRSLCDAAWASCRSPADIAAGVGGSLLNDANPLAAGLGFNNCSSQIGSRDVQVDASMELCSAQTFMDRFPIGATYTSSGFTISTNIMASATAQSVVAAVPPCPEPLKFTNDPERSISGGSCALPCPNLSFTDEEYQRAGEIFLVFSTIGLCCTSLLLFTYAAFKKTRRRIYTVYFTFSIFAVSAFLTFSPLAGNPGAENGKTPGIFPRVMCIDDTHPSKNGYCVWVSTVMVFGGGSAVAWWFVQAIDLWLQISYNARRWAPDKQHKKEIGYYLWAWGYPFTAAVIANQLNKLGNGLVGIPWCFFDETQLGDDLGWGLFYAPVAAQCVLGALAMSVIIAQLYKSSVAMKRHAKKGWWKLYFKPLIFILLLEIVWTVIFAFRFDAYLRRDELKQEGVNLATCLLVTRPSAAASGQTIECPPRPSVHRGLWYAIHVAIAGVGLWTFLLYYTEENFVMWYHWLTCKPYNYSKTSGGSTSGSSKTRETTRQGSKRVLYTGGAKKKAGASAASSTMDITGSGEKQSMEMGTVQVEEEAPVGGGLQNLSGDLPTNLEVNYRRDTPEPESGDEAI